MYNIVRNNNNGASDTSMANWRQSKYAPTENDSNTPKCPATFCIELKKPRISGDDISLM